MSEAPEKGGYIKQAWLVILLALVYGAALAGVQTTLGPMIVANKENETFQQIPDLVPGADLEKSIAANRDREEPLAVVGTKDKEQRIYQAVDAAGATVGWILPAGDQGFADRIEVLIGLDPQVTTVTGLYVLDQKETPGLGNYIAQPPDFRNQFVGKPTAEEFTVVKTEPAEGSNQIEALSGATISSKAVAKIVNDAIAHYGEAIRKQQ